MPFLDYVLQSPSYGWQCENGKLVRPGKGVLLKEFLNRLNVFNDRKNWLPFFSWLKVICLVPFLFLFLFKYLSPVTFGAAFIYSMMIMGTHGTIWHHRYCTHGAYKFKNAFWRFVTQQLTLNIIPEEIYVISHHVHHAKSDQPGDPYNAQGGFWYCFLADVNHQPIAKDLAEADYQRVQRLMAHTGIKANTYQQYQHWGSYANPVRSVAAWLLNWGFWYMAFYLMGGHALACSLFAAAGIWAVGVRTFNYDGHGHGKDKQREGVDYNRNDRSINQLWPGYVAGEWHNNHHLYPKSARSGFKAHQLDMAWLYIRLLYRLGAVSSYRDDKRTFLAKYIQTAHVTQHETT
ncbi:stearoyl-CoA desaturase (delta-9 desaturase) [Mucilaginibacter yixingensis]|uniref:Stearoyl-CoA desaturase (Delta-9 desaturase) n=1 Tax=Mucilaginibacter yixingensis TaxID=1295612 RepID=A0A2T5JEJ9_9SPHI|nr:fatty acid desaturase [Mucilaginibacter yixingensis]PTR00839.1 stearoyl-CoA desaturase (delta-9 desaturase) [Mucilaginibacter yixingensis]